MRWATSSSGSGTDLRDFGVWAQFAKDLTTDVFSDGDFIGNSLSVPP